MMTETARARERGLAGNYNINFVIELASGDHQTVENVVKCLLSALRLVNLHCHAQAECQQQ